MPMRGGPLAIEQPRGREDEDARADRNQPRPRRVRRAQSAKQRIGRSFVHVPAGNDDGPGASQHTHPMRAWTRIPPVPRSGARSRENTRNSYQGTFSSGRDSPNTSETIPSSNVPMPSYAMAARFLRSRSAMAGF